MDVVFAGWKWPGGLGFPRVMPEMAEHVATVEWSWAPGSGRQDRYHISYNEVGTHWILWLGTFDENRTFDWKYVPYAFAAESGEGVDQAACGLLQGAWESEVAQEPLFKRFHAVSASGLISDEQLERIANRVWGDAARIARQDAADKADERELIDIRSRAQKGEPPALNQLAYRHFFGRGVGKSEDLAFQFWSEAAEQKHPWSMFSLAVCLRDGFGVSKDETHALAIYEELAALGYYVGFTQAIYCLRVGIGCKPSPERALRWSFELAKGVGPQRHDCTLVSLLAETSGNSAVHIEARRWITDNADEHYACRGMLTSLDEKEAAGRSEELIRHAAGSGWFSPHDGMRNLF